MLRAIYAMLSSGTPYPDRAVNHDGLNVARNAPRGLKMPHKHGLIATPAAA